MKNNDLIIKLKKLGEIKPDQKFLKENRDLLLTQISNSRTDKISSFENFLLTSENLARLFSRPAFALGVFILVLLGANFSSALLQNFKPNDSLYLARIISEQVKVNTTINQVEREKLAISYALRHAEDIASILSDEQFNIENNYDQVAKLNTSFINEVNKVENRLSRLNISAPKTNTTEQKNEVKIEMIIADNSKDDNGLSIFIPEDKNTSTLSTSSALNLSEEETASSTEKKDDVIKVEESVKIDSSLKVNQAKELAEKGDLSGALNKLNEAIEALK